MFEFYLTVKRSLLTGLTWGITYLMEGTGLSLCDWSSCLRVLKLNYRYCINLVCVAGYPTSEGYVQQAEEVKVFKLLKDSPGSDHISSQYSLTDLNT